MEIHVSFAAETPMTSAWILYSKRYLAMEKQFSVELVVRWEFWCDS